MDEINDPFGLPTFSSAQQQDFKAMIHSVEQYQDEQKPSPKRSSSSKKSSQPVSNVHKKVTGTSTVTSGSDVAITSGRGTFSRRNKQLRGEYELMDSQIEQVHNDINRLMDHVESRDAVFSRFEKMIGSLSTEEERVVDQQERVRLLRAALEGDTATLSDKLKEKMSMLKIRRLDADTMCAAAQMAQIEKLFIKNDERFSREELGAMLTAAKDEFINCSFTAFREEKSFLEGYQKRYETEFRRLLAEYRPCIERQAKRRDEINQRLEDMKRQIQSKKEQLEEASKLRNQIRHQLLSFRSMLKQTNETDEKRLREIAHDLRNTGDALNSSTISISFALKDVEERAREETKQKFLRELENVKDHREQVLARKEAFIDQYRKTLEDQYSQRAQHTLNQLRRQRKEEEETVSSLEQRLKDIRMLNVHAKRRLKSLQVYRDTTILQDKEGNEKLLRQTEHLRRAIREAWKTRKVPNTRVRMFFSRLLTNLPYSDEAHEGLRQLAFRLHARIHLVSLASNLDSVLKELRTVKRRYSEGSPMLVKLQGRYNSLKKQIVAEMISFEQQYGTQALVHGQSIRKYLWETHGIQAPSSAEK